MFELTVVADQSSATETPRPSGGVVSVAEDRLENRPVSTLNLMPTWHRAMMVAILVITIGLAVVALWSPVAYLNTDPNLGSHQWHLIWQLPVGIISFILLWAFSAWIRWKFLRYLGFTGYECREIYAHRRRFSLAQYRVHHSEQTLKLADGIPRKGNHILTTLYGLFFLTVVLDTDPQNSLIFSLVSQTLNIIVSILMLDRNLRPAKVLYGVASRIRDGRLARLNILTARVTSLFAYITLFLILGIFKDDLGPPDSDQLSLKRRLVLLTSVLPTAIGDALGEIVGSLWGRHQYRVIGVGEVNLKSIEGSLAVFFGSAMPVYFAWLIYGEASQSTVYVALIIGFSSTLVEAYAPRSTDNYALPVTNALWCWLFYHLRWI